MAETKETPEEAAEIEALSTVTAGDWLEVRAFIGSFKGQTKYLDKGTVRTIEASTLRPLFTAGERG